MTNIQLSISDALSNGWALWKKHCLLFAVAYFCIHTIAYFIEVIIKLPFSTTQFYFPTLFYDKIQPTDALSANIWDYLQNEQSIWSFVATSISTIIVFPFITGIENCILNINKGIDNGFSLNGYKMPIATYLKCYVISIIVGAICMVGYIFFIIPGVYLNARLVFAKTYQLDNNEADITECIKKSWEMTQDNVLSMIGLVILKFCIGLLGLSVCCIGTFFASPLELFIHNDAYLQMKKNIQTNKTEYQQ